MLGRNILAQAEADVRVRIRGGIVDIERKEPIKSAIVPIAAAGKSL